MTCRQTDVSKNRYLVKRNDFAEVILKVSLKIFLYSRYSCHISLMSQKINFRNLQGSGPNNSQKCILKIKVRPSCHKNYVFVLLFVWFISCVEGHFFLKLDWIKVGNMWNIDLERGGCSGEVLSGITMARIHWKQ